MWVIPKNLRMYPSARDTEALISDSEELSDLLEQSVLWRSKPSASKTWLRRLKVGGSTPRLFSQTLKPSHGESLLDEWISSVEASLVSHLAPQEDVKEAMIPDTYGLISQTESSDWGDLPLFSLKTSRELSQVSSKEMIGATQREHLFCSMSSASWKDWVTMQRQAYSQRLKSVRPINESECLFLVSEMTSDRVVLISSMQCLEMNAEQPIQKEGEQINTLGNHRESRWATPNTMDCLPLRSEEALRKQAMGARKSRKHPANLREQVDPTSVQIYKEVNWATPMAGSKDHMGSSVEYYKRREEKGKQVDLQGQILLEKWTTPIARDCYEIEMNFQIPTRKDGKHRLDTMPRQIHHQEGYKGKLNPRWVETLMGLPIGWTMPSCTNPVIIEQTNLDSWEMESFPTPPQQPSSPCGETWATPQARDYKGTQGRTNREGALRDLPAQTEGPWSTWPTPSARDWKGPQSPGYKDRGYGALLPDEVKEQNWPTPPASQRGEDLKVYIKKSISEGGTPFAPTLQVAVEAAQNGTTPEEALHSELNREAKLFSNHSELLDESVLLPREYDKCIIKVDNGKVNYAQDCVLNVLAEESLKNILSGVITCHEEHTLEESSRLHAIEWFDSNLDGAYMGPYSPVYVIEEEED